MDSGMMEENIHFWGLQGVKANNQKGRVAKELNGTLKVHKI